MERLTSNKSVSEMGMYELAHNSCYAKDGKARVRDFEDDSDARELAIKLLEKYADIPNEFTCDEDFDDFMADSLLYGTYDNVLRLIAVFYQNLWAMADLRERLKEYEDLEEQGKLLKLPCAVGDAVYVIPSSENFGINIVNRHEENNRVYEQIVDHVEMRRSGYLLSTCDGMACVIEEFYKETWFTDKKEAEVKLKELERYWKKVFQEKNKV